MRLSAPQLTGSAGASDTSVFLTRRKIEGHGDHGGLFHRCETEPNAASYGLILQYPSVEKGDDSVISVALDLPPCQKLRSRGRHWCCGIRSGANRINHPGTRSVPKQRRQPGERTAQSLLLWRHCQARPCGVKLPTAANIYRHKGFNFYLILIRVHLR